MRVFPDKGRGIFALEDIKQGEVIEIAPVLVFSPKESDYVMQTQLRDCVFQWGSNKSAAALGYGMVYNHSDNPNAYYQKREHRQDMIYIALKDIKAGEEITVSYGDHWWKKRGVNPL